MQLAVPDVDGEHQARAVGQQHLGEAAGGSADVEADVVLDLDRILLQRAGQLDAAARDVRVRRFSLRARHRPRSPRRASPTGVSLAVTRPASIAARARARLSNRPRSTSSTSDALAGRRLACRDVGRLRHGAIARSRPPAATQASNAAEIVPDIGRRLPRRHQRAAMQIERVDHHRDCPAGRNLPPSVPRASIRRPSDGRRHVIEARRRGRHRRRDRCSRPRQSLPRPAM